MVKPVVHTQRLTMRPFALGDAAVVQRLAGDPEVALTTLSIPHPYEDGMAEQWISNHEASWEAKQSLTLAMTNESEGVVGATNLALNMDHQRGEIGFWIGHEYWNRGYATEATAALIDFGFGELNLNRIQGRHFPRNAASGRVMQKAGMKYEGLLRQHHLVRGEFEDVAFYSILTSDR
jgi:RimJ/RimL family protein N-acetyltransferase